MKTNSKNVKIRVSKHDVNYFDIKDIKIDEYWVDLYNYQPNKSKKKGIILK